MGLVPDQPHEDMSISAVSRRRLEAGGDAEQHRCRHPCSIQNGELGRVHQRYRVVTGYGDDLLLDL